MTDRMVQETIDTLRAVFDVMKSDEYTESVASFCWNLFIKLKEKGFSDEVASMIVGQMVRTSK